MVAVVHFPDGIRRVLNYNEQKVKEGVATCIDAPYYLKEAGKLTFDQKLDRLQRLVELNDRTKVNTVHISLNFPPEERHSEEKLKEIASAYIQKIGFEGQPYLLYQHFDAGHPHVHILTTNIRPDGKRISLHNIGKITSENARKEIEMEFNLIKAEDKSKRSAYELKPVNAKLEYGKASTKRAITGVLNTVFADYKFTTLGELNAVLNLYNVSAERGAENSRIYKNRGLVYRIRTEDGDLIGTPIKASSIYGNPTLRTLDLAFANHRTARLKHKTKLKVAIDVALMERPNGGLKQFVSSLEKQGIDTVLRYTKDGKVFGITYVDHNSSCVFNGNALGKAYSATSIQQRCGEISPGKDLKESSLQLIQTKATGTIAGSGFTPAPLNHLTEGSPESLLELLIQVERDSNSLPYELSGRKKNKRKKNRYKL